MQSDDLGLVPVAWRYRYKTDRTGDEWDDWIAVPVDPNDWDWAPAWHDFEAQPLYDAAATERLVAERDEARRQFWLELREPGCVPERKGPWPHHMTAMTLREFMRERPEAFITVISFADGVLLLQDGPECLQMLDGRSMSTGRKHIKSSNAARARQALGDTL